jgi:hypothetical protein
MYQLVSAAAPHLRGYGRSGPPVDSPDRAEWQSLWNQISPVKFGNTVLWSAATEYTLADYQIPREAEYNIVLRVECYTLNLTSGAADYGMSEPPPPGKAFWRYIPYGSGVSYNLTDITAQSHLLLDVDEFKIFKAGYNLALIGNFNAASDGATRNVRTIVYSYNVGAGIVERIGGNTIMEPSSNGV